MAVREVGRPTDLVAERKVVRVGECAEGDHCPRYHCLECGEYWLGNRPHRCGSGSVAYLRGPSSSGEELTITITTWMREALAEHADVEASARDVLRRVKAAALVEALLDAYGARLIIEVWREHQDEAHVAPVAALTSHEPPRPQARRSSPDRVPTHGERRVDVEQLATESALLESIFYVDGRWIRLGDLDRHQCRALQLKHELMAREFRRLADALDEGQTVRQRWTTEQLEALIGDTLRGAAPHRPIR